MSARRARAVVRARLVVATLVAAVVVVGGVAGCTAEPDRQAPAEQPASSSPASGATTTPGPASPESTDLDAPPSPGSAGPEDGRPLVVLFFAAETVDPRDDAAVARGDIPASLRVLDGPSTPVASTTLTCPARRQRVIDVPVRRDGLRQLRSSARVVARLADGRDVAVLGPRTDLAVLLVRDREGRVRARASALQIDDRWFVGEVEDCRGPV